MNDLVFSQNNKVYASSLKVAEIFQKRHDNVLRDIEEIIEDFPIQEHLHSFEETERSWTNNLGKIVKDKVYQMTRDGFAILVMKDNSMKVEFEVKTT